jgi:hypothetical protein
MARTASAAHRQQLEQMAETWEQLAQSRQRQLHRMSGNMPPEDVYKIYEKNGRRSVRWRFASLTDAEKFARQFGGSVVAGR